MASEDYLSDGLDPSLLDAPATSPEPSGEMAATEARRQSHFDAEERVEELKAYFGGMWANCPKYPVANWQHEVANDDTRLGYWEWVYHQIDCALDRAIDGDL